MNKKRILILCIICICIFIIITLSFFALKHNNINFLEKRSFTDTKQNVIDGMEFFVYDNTEEKLKTLVRIQRENGIETVEYIDDNNEKVILDCYGKQCVSIDIKVELNKEYSFLVSSDGNVTTEKFMIDEAYMSELLDGIMFIENITEKDLTTEEEIRKAKVQFYNMPEGKTNYYHVGKTGTWVKCENTDVNEVSVPQDNDIDLVDVVNGKKIIEVYARQVDEAGNSLVKKAEFNVDTVKLDVFNDMRVLGKIPQQYGFTASWSKSESSAFTVGNFQAGHYSGAASWSGTFNWNNPKTYGATQLYLYINHYSQNIYSTASSRVTITYSDGTTYTKTNPTTKATKYFPITIDLKEGIEISRIQFYFSGYDDHASSSRAGLTRIILKRNKITSNRIKT